MFAMAYDFVIPLKHILGYEVGNHMGRYGIESGLGHHDLTPIYDVCAYAECHMAGPQARSMLSKILCNDPAIWKSIEHWPARFIRLAIELKCRDLYFDASRQLIATYNFKLVAQELDVSLEEAKSTWQPALESVKYLVYNPQTGLQNRILRLTLTGRQRIKNGEGQWHNSQPVFAKVSFLQAMAADNKYPTDSIMPMERVDFIACNAFRDLFLGYMIAAEQHDVARGCTGRPPPLNEAFDKLVKASITLTPADAIGPEVPEPLVDFFDLDTKYDPVVQIRTKLKELVREAAKEINSTFDTKLRRQIDGSTMTIRCAKWAGPYFTYLPLDEERLPWVEDDHVGKHDEEGDAPSADLTEAAEETLRAYGLVGQAPPLERWPRWSIDGID